LNEKGLSLFVDGSKTPVHVNCKEHWQSCTLFEFISVLTHKPNWTLDSNEYTSILSFIEQFKQKAPQPFSAHGKLLKRYVDSIANSLLSHPGWKNASHEQLHKLKINLFSHLLQNLYPV
jgi:hypothetical protein